MRPKRPKFITIHEVLYDLKMSPNSKLVFANIGNICLNGMSGEYLFDNKFIQGFTGLSERGVSKIISGLVNSGFIVSELEYYKGTQKVHHRVLKLSTWSAELLGQISGEQKCVDNNQVTSSSSGSNNKQYNNNKFCVSNDVEPLSPYYGDTSTARGGSLANGEGSPSLPADEGTLSTPKSASPEVIGGQAGLSFLQFWSLYDYKKNREAAMKAWGKIDPKLYQTIFEAIPVYVANTGKTQDEGKTLRAYPASWLNACRWDDEVTLSQEAVDAKWEEEMRAR